MCLPFHNTRDSNYVPMSMPNEPCSPISVCSVPFQKGLIHPVPGLRPLHSAVSRKLREHFPVPGMCVAPLDECFVLHLTSGLG